MDENNKQTEDSSLDNKATVIEQNSSSEGISLDSTQNANAATQMDAPRFTPKKPFVEKLQNVVGKINIYFLLFILVVLIAGIATFASYKTSKDAEKAATINGQTLSQEDLQKLKNNESTIGDPKQTLTVASNAVFNGRVLIRDSLDVAGTIRIGGALSLPGITVSGTSSFENVQIASNLSIAGNAAVQGTLTVQRNLSVGGSASFAGAISAPQLSIDRLILNSDLQINRHIDAGGPTPRVGSGTAVGGAGTVSISGTDTAGTVSVNFGTGPVAGIIANITFSNSFSQTPHIVITPVGSSCANLNYYVSRTTGGFSIGTTNSAGSGSSCAFDYVAID